jgi:hypothetical protein
MRIDPRAVIRVSTSQLCLFLAPRLPHQAPRKCVLGKELSVLDIVYVLTAIAAFAVVGLIARAVEKL